MARRRTGFVRPRGQRRRTSWSAFLEETFTLGMTAIQLGAVGFSTAQGKETLARIHGLFTVNLVTAGGADEGFRGAIGIGKVQDEAFVAGVASVPDPTTEVGWDGWMYHQWFDVRSGSATEADWLGGFAAFQRSIVDVKSMRIIDEQEDFIVVISATETGTATATARIQTRALLLLP